ncbi:WD40 repeat domain-containing protein [Hydrogenimonas thermophila]|uniref:WD40 repeat domain-containing protein n=1 Tax=Hydrogenimonas thermophila TaxID=223786 RepID=UPI002936F307|nr:WD40 repeat domain-containing protein [Hydrogenimonas thermophila]WOE71033.1 WD40 repeat domain-containing protein [Hydrogenimonas thermophila]WOE73551.1 WD40 repeat domain-containing protein [Hydrogenimonas thermophila]
MVIEKRLHLKSRITALKPLENGGLVVIDGSNAVRFFKSNPIEIEDGFKAAFNGNEQLYQGCDVSIDGKFVAFCAVKDGVLVFLSKNKKLVYRFKRHEGEVESVCISPKYNYLATGGQDGKTFLWNLSNGKMVASLPHHADFVTAIAFSQNGRWIATGSYDRKIKVTNVLSLGKEIVLKAHSQAITNIHFISDNRLVSSDKSGGILVWDYFSKKLIVRLEKMLDEVTSLSFTPDGKFMFASDKSGYVSLYDMQEYSLISQRYIYYSNPIRKLAYIPDGNHLVVGLDNGELVFHAPLKEEDKLREFIENGKYSDAHELIKSNPLLRYTDAFIELEAKWEETYQQALLFLESGKIDKAKKIFEPFKDEPSKRLIIQKLLSDYKEFEKFKQAVLSKKYPVAYSIVNQSPMLKENRYYNAMEDEWQRAFSEAKKIILKTKSDDKVKEILKPFRGISSKATLIQSLLAEKEVYRLFMRLISKKDYKDALEFAKKYPIIQEFDEYKKIEKISEILLAKAQEAFTKGEYAETIKYAKELMEYPDKKAIAEELIEQATTYMKTLRYFSEKNYAAVYKMVELYPYLLETKIVEKLEQAWQKVVEKAETFASKGDVIALKKILSSFYSYPQKHHRIVSFFKEAYIVQIERLIREKKPEAKKAIMRYVDIFGEDDEILALMIEIGLKERFEKEAVPYSSIKIESLPDSLI